VPRGQARRPSTGVEKKKKIVNTREKPKKAPQVATEPKAHARIHGHDDLTA